MRPPFSCFLVSAGVALFLGLVPRAGAGQALVGFHPTTLHVTKYFLGPHAPLAAVYGEVLDSLSRRYGVPVDTLRSYQHTFSLEGRVEYTPNLRYPGRFQYTHTAVLRDAAGQREVYRVDTQFKDLADLAQHPQALQESFRKTYTYLFRFLAGYGATAGPGTGPALRLVFAPSPPSADRARVQALVEEVFARNQGKLGYRLLRPGDAAAGTVHTVRVALVATAPAGLTVTWALGPEENTQFQGVPIATTFGVTAADLARGDYSYLMAKMTASLIKLDW